MKRALSADNPFANNRLDWAYGFEFIAPGSRLLDYGCYDGTFLARLAQVKRVEAYGVDKNADVLRAAGMPNLTHIQKALPFADGFFDVVTMFEVLEHIHDQDYVLGEARRVLKPGGILIVTVPRRHAFSFLDHGNFKYRFPGIHKFWYTRRHSRADYDYRYVSNPHGLIGDVDKEKAWHQHFRDQEMRALLARNGFALRDIDGAGAFSAMLNLLQFAGLRFLARAKLRRWQARRFAAEQLYCVAART